MKTVKIKHKPFGMGCAFGAAGAFLIIMMTAALLSIDKPGGAAATVISLVLLVVLIIAGFVVEECETEVKCFDDRLECTMLGRHWNIDLVKLEEITYTVSTHHSRYSHWNTIDLEFCYKGDSEEFLSVKVSANELGDCMSGRQDEVPVMQIYNWVVGLYPEKAGGFRKQEEMW
ncbi:MAG: hypothetical protein J5501_09820 [Ruminococcus sp.]|nr:hypothetical protein [Ruminococcus sp.]